MTKTYSTLHPDIFALLNKMKESIAKTDIIFKKSLDILADHGWYISLSMPYLQIFHNALNSIKNKPELIDQKMIKFYSKQKKDLVKNIISKYPDRETILKQALKCHEKRFYFASTSLFLSTADGICIGKLFKVKKNKKEGLREFLEQENSTDYLKEVLIKIRGVDCYSGATTNHNSNLNRHQVMHGLSLDYGTEMNSLKALSLLNFIAEFITDKYSEKRTET